MRGLISKSAVVGVVGVGAVVIAGAVFGVPTGIVVGAGAVVVTACANVGNTCCSGDHPCASAGSCAVSGCPPPLLLLLLSP